MCVFFACAESQPTPSSCSGSFAPLRRLTFPIMMFHHHPPDMPAPSRTRVCLGCRAVWPERKPFVVLRLPRTAKGSGGTQRRWCSVRSCDVGHCIRLIYVTLTSGQPELAKDHHSFNGRCHKLLVQRETNIYCFQCKLGRSSYVSATFYQVPSCTPRLGRQ